MDGRKAGGSGSMNSNKWIDNTLTPGPSPIKGEGSRVFAGEGRKAGQTHRSAPTVAEEEIMC